MFILLSVPPRDTSLNKKRPYSDYQIRTMCSINKYIKKGEGVTGKLLTSNTFSSGSLSDAAHSTNTAMC